MEMSTESPRDRMSGETHNSPVLNTSGDKLFRGAELKSLDLSPLRERSTLELSDHQKEMVNENMRCLWRAMLEMRKRNREINKIVDQKVQLKERLIGNSSDLEIIFNPTRKFIQEGDFLLKKKDRKTNERHYFLFDDVLVISKLKQPKRYSIKQLISLKNVEKFKKMDEGDSSYELSTKDRTYYIGLKSDLKFYELLKECIHSSGQKVFGIPLEILCKRKDTVDGIPKILRQLTECIRSDRCIKEGLFRLSGNQTQIHQLKDKYDQGVYEDLKAVDCHVVTNILKLFLRELPEPLVTFSLYLPLLDIASSMNSDHDIQPKIAELRYLLHTLPSSHFKVLHYLCSFLSDISKRAEITKMGAINLAIVFASNVMRPEQESEGNSFALERLQTLMRTFINHVSELFGTTSESSEDEEDENWVEELAQFCLSEDPDVGPLEEDVEVYHAGSRSCTVPRLSARRPEVPNAGFDVSSPSRKDTLTDMSSPSAERFNTVTSKAHAESPTYTAL
uniref:Rho-GAP domain-containing protein n=1 Tax=Arcella intermedia TaxID=1963864 RepID=A0A6B2L232_9EUKA